MIDREKFIGYELPSIDVDVEKGQLSLFALATGETNPVYTNLEAAAEAGHAGLPAPLTFTFVLNLLARSKAGAAGDYLAKMGVNIGHLLHGEQAFDYFEPIYSGDVITLSPRISDIYDKKNGKMEFFVLSTDATNQRGELCVRMRNTLVVRHPEASA